MASPLATARWIGGLLLLIPSGLLAQNLIRNPSFEDGGPAGAIAAWSVNPSWYIDPKEKGLASVSADADVFQGMGRRSLKMDGQGKRGLAQQSLAGRFTPGERLRLSGWMKFENIRPAFGRISVSFHGQNGEWLGQRDITTDWRIKTLDWQRCFGDGSHATRPWPFDEPWDALVFRVRRVKGNATLQLCLSRQGVAFRAAALRPAEDWTRLVIWRDEIRYAWGAKTESQKAFSPVGVNRLEWSADGPMVVEVDAIRLWAADRVGMLYYWPQRELSSSVEVAAPVIGRLIQFERDEAKGQTLHHVRWSGLTFTQTDYSPDDGCRQWGVGNDGTIYLRGAVGCTIENCRFTLGGKAAVLLQGGRENVIAGNDVSESAEGAIVLHDSAANSIIDNHVHHLGAVYKHVGGIVIMRQGSRDNRIAHNLVHDMTRWGISLQHSGTGNVVEYNEVFNTSLETYDTGGINTYQDDRKFLCNTVVRYNLVHDGVGYSSILGKPLFDSRGIYIDGFSSGYTITHNIVYRNSANGGIFIQGGHDIRIHNNICVDNGAPQYLHANFQQNGANLQFTRNILGTRDGRVDLMWIYQGGEKLTQFDENLYWHPRPTFPVAGTLAAWQALGRDTHSVLGDPLFVNPDAADYSLRPDSPALKLGFEPIDAGQIGLLRKRCSCPRKPVSWQWPDPAEAREQINNPSEKEQP